MTVTEEAAGGPGTIDAALGLLEALQVRAEVCGPRRHDDGLACVNRLWTGVVREMRDRLAAGGTFADTEFAMALVVVLTRRYLQAVGELRADAAPRSWRVLLDRRAAADVTSCQFELAGITVLVHHDLAPALVSTCTVLGRPLGQIEKTDCEAFIGIVAEHVRRMVPGAGSSGDYADELGALTAAVSRNGAWVLAEHLWTLRGRPAEAEAERAAIDWRASMIGRAILTPLAP